MAMMTHLVMPSRFSSSFDTVRKMMTCSLENNDNLLNEIDSFHLIALCAESWATYSAPSPLQEVQIGSQRNVLHDRLTVMCNVAISAH